MHVFSNIPTYKTFRNALDPGQSVGFVPTMGALHAGHISLVEQARRENELVVVSIFVNPTQFGPKEDFGKYPRTLEADIEMLKQAGATALFAPQTAEVYPISPSQITFGIRDMDKKLCGKSRPGHFNGVVQVVSLLFHLIRPHRAYFGQKDYQQLMILRQLVREQHFDVEVIGCPIVRETDGLAMSSRNRYLNEAERRQAAKLYEILQKVRANYRNFDSVEALNRFVADEIAQHDLLRLDYFELWGSADLGEILNLSEAKSPHAFIAAFCGTTRLIDNLQLFA